MVYLGQTCAARSIGILNIFNFGECTNRGNRLPPYRYPWFADNGAYMDWTAGKEFDAEKYMRGLVRFDEYKPDFVVVPDVVAGGAESLAFSLEWLPVVRDECKAPVYLAVQNGMTAATVEPHLSLFDGLFVGGDNRWKVDTAEKWIALAHLNGMPCHIGRAGTKRKAAWARRIGADSIDSCLPLWSMAQLREFLVGLGLLLDPSTQTEMFAQ